MLPPEDLNVRIEELSGVGDPSRARSFAALDRAAQSADLSRPVSSVAPCPLPYLDLVFRHASGEPIAGAACVLDFPAGGGKKATTDADGRAHFVDVDADASELVAQIEPVDDEDAGTTTYRIKVVQKAARGGAEPRGATEEEPLLYLLAGEQEDDGE